MRREGSNTAARDAPSGISSSSNAGQGHASPKHQQVSLTPTEYPTESATDLRLQLWLAWDTDAAPNTHQVCVWQVVLVPVARPGDDATCINKRYDSLQESFQVSLTALRLALSGNT